MPYQCSDCKKTFLHTAKLTEFSTPQDIELNEDVTAKGVMNTLDSSVCPFCKSKSYTEVTEVKETGGIKLEDVVSLKDCAPNDADAWLAQGYKLFQTWQKNVFVVKLKEKPVENKELGQIISKAMQEAKA